MTAQSAPARLFALHVALLDGRRAQRLTQQQLADRLGVDRRTVQRWEDSSCAASGEDLFRWADALGIVISFAPMGTSGTSAASETDAGPQAVLRAPRAAERVVRFRDRSHGAPRLSLDGENAAAAAVRHVKARRCDLPARGAR